MPLLSLHVDADELFEGVPLLVDATKAEELLTNEQSRHVTPLCDQLIRFVPDIHRLEVACRRIELDYLRSAKPHFQVFVEAKASEEVVQFALVGA